MEITRYLKEIEFDQGLFTKDDYLLLEFDCDRYARENLEKFWWADPIDHDYFMKEFISITDEGKAWEFAGIISKHLKEEVTTPLIEKAEKARQAGETRTVIIYTRGDMDIIAEDLLEIWKEHTDKDYLEPIWKEA